MTSAARPTTQARRFAALDGYRAVAALTVVTYHVTGKFGVFYTQPILGPFLARLGNFGVTVFFLLSGFLLYRPFVLAHLREGPAPSPGKFYFRRLVRIVPAYWVALTFLFFVFQYRSANGADGYLTYYGFAQVYRGNGYPIGGLGPAWSLCVEMSFYLLLPLVAYGISTLDRARRLDVGGRLRCQFIGLGTLYAIGLGYRVWAAGPGDTASSGGNPPLGLVDLFALGMLLAVLSAWIEIGQRLPPLVDHFRARPWLCWAGAIEFYWVLSALHAPLSFEQEGGGQFIGRTAFAGLAAFMFLIPGTIGTADQSVSMRFMRSWPMAALGTVSYGIYLWHTQFLELVLNMRDSGQLPDNLFVALAAVSVFSIAAAIASYWFVERPFMRLRRRRPAGAATRRGEPPDLGSGSRLISKVISWGARADPPSPSRCWLVRTASDTQDGLADWHLPS
jgi:peptidoglycan/LPS O-acetylase OafA/YrhL